MKYTHSYLLWGERLQYRYNDGVITYRYKGRVCSIYGYYGFCFEDRIIESIKLHNDAVS